MNAARDLFPGLGSLLLWACAATPAPPTEEVSLPPPASASVEAPRVELPRDGSGRASGPEPTAFPGSVPSNATNGREAQQLFEEGRALVSQNRWAEACPKFEASAAIDMALGTLFNLAACRERIGDTRGACKAYLEAGLLAKPGDARAQLIEQNARALGCP